jgi:tryptophan synthase beta chain
MDLVGYNKYLAGELHDYEYPESEIAENLKKLEGYPLPK